jgi:hypothetical protein
MAVATIAGRVVLDDVAGEHHLAVRHPDHRIAGRMRAAEVHDVDPAVAEIDRHASENVVVGQVSPGMLSWPWNRRGKRWNSLSQSSCPRSATMARATSDMMI